MGNYLAILWTAWSIGATLLALGLLLLNGLHRKRAGRKMNEFERSALPTLREELLWTVLVIVPGAVCLSIMLLLLPEGHTARSLLVGVVLGMFMLLGLAMLLKNRLAPMDTIRLAQVMPDTEEAEPEDAGQLSEIGIEQPRLRSGPLI